MQLEIRISIPFIYGGNNTYPAQKVIFINVLLYTQMQSIIRLSKKIFYLHFVK